MKHLQTNVLLQEECNAASIWIQDIVDNLFSDKLMVSAFVSSQINYKQSDSLTELVNVTVLIKRKQKTLNSYRIYFYKFIMFRSHE